MPHWLQEHDLATRFDKLKKAYVAQFGTTDWKEKLKSTQFQHIDGFALYYCITALENNLAYNAETETLLKEIAAQNP